MKKTSTYAQSWHWYIDGNVVSDHQVRIITSFMQLNAGHSTTDAELDANLFDLTGVKETLGYDNTQSVECVHKLLGRTGGIGL